MQHTQERKSISRRSVVAGAAWMVPAVVTANALPAYAASNSQTTVAVSGVTENGNSRTITVTFTTSDNSAVAADTKAVISVTLTDTANVQSLTIAEVTNANPTVSPIPATLSPTTPYSAVTVLFTASVASPATVTLNLGGAHGNNRAGTAAVANVTPAPGNGTATWSTTSVKF